MANTSIYNNLAAKLNYSILLYGDSIMKGIVYDNIKQRYTRLGNAFANTLKTRLNASITNSARFGNTVGRAIKKFYNDITIKKPDIVVLEFGGNDCDFKWQEIATDPLAEHNPNTKLNDFIQTFTDMIEQLNKLSIAPVVLTLPPIHSEKYFNWISKNDTKSAENILKWLGSIDKIYTWQEQYNKAVYQISNNTDTAVIDIRDEFMKKGDFSDLLCIDGIHPNENGHKLIANTIEKYIEEKFPFLLKNQPTAS